ncbi:unnamed protein product [Symbiodinium pilosum]|uniref:Apple domain-containing protein n=1 Tax=Symbiodinium pilosum TaxID=2952 RepID=A0A812P3I1_SYMPI|nr:unnamed protein product [Symbiodinium pilosum]
MISTMFGPHLRELEFHPSSFCKEKTPVAAENMKQCAELCQAAGTECGAFTYVPGEASGSSCFHSKRCESMGESDEGAMVFVKTASGQEEDPAIMEDHTAEER